MTLLLFLLAAWGAGYVVAESKLLRPLRTWVECLPPFTTCGEKRTSYPAILLSCAACVGFWAGATLSWFAISPVTPYLHPDVQHPRIVAAVLDGLIACGVNYLGAMFVMEVMNAVIERLARKP